MSNLSTIIPVVKFAVFIAACLLTMLGAHYLIYASVIRFIPISDPLLRKILLWVMVCLALSFLPSALLVRFHYNAVTGGLYTLSCLWLGLFIYLLMAPALTWLIFGLGNLFHYVPNMRLVVIGCFFLASAVSIYGVWRAQRPELKHLQVKIENLPLQWKDSVIIHLSDLHLGVINGNGFLNRIVEKVNKLKPRLILITGDLFDGMGGPLHTFKDTLNAFNASKGIFFVTGNHEGYLGLKPPLSVLKETSFHILDNEIVEIDGLQIIGIRFPEHDKKNQAYRLLSNPKVYDTGKPSILLYHTPTNIGEHHMDRGTQQTNTYWYPDTDMTLAKEMGIDLQLSGHTHRGQFFPFGLLTRLIYKGFDYGLHKLDGFQIYVSSGVGTWGPPMRVGCPPEIVVIHLDGS